MNLPPNIPSEVLSKYKEIVEKIQYNKSIAKGQIYNEVGTLVWEETEDDYQTRMNKLFYEAK